MDVTDATGETNSVQSRVKIGYVGIEFKVNFGKKFVQDLRDNLASNEDFLEEKGLAALSGYFDHLFRLLEQC